MQIRVARGVAPTVLALFSCLAGAAVAADWRIGASVGPSQGRVDCVAGKISVAYQLAPAFDAQLAYLGGSRFAGGGTMPLGTLFGGTFKVDAVGLTAGYRWAFAPLWSGVARAGVASVHSRFDDAAPASGSRGKTTVQPLIGLGVAYQVSPAISVGLDYDATRMKAYTSHGSLQMLGIAAQLSF